MKCGDRLGSHVLRMLFEGPRQLREYRLMRFSLTKTRRHVRALMREGRVLMQDVVATYHEVAASRNWFQRAKGFAKTELRTAS